MNNNIYNCLDYETKIKRKETQICIIGMGTIGLAEAIFFAYSGFQVIGYDINNQRVKQIINSSCLCEYPLMLKNVIDNGSLRATTNSKLAIQNSDFIIICVPTPVDEKKQIDLSYVFDAAKSIGNNIQKGAILIFESSVSPGSTMAFCNKIEEYTELKHGSDFGLAYVPERYNPILPSEVHEKISYTTLKNNISTDYKYTIDKINRVIGAIDDRSLSATMLLYKQMLKANIYPVSSIETAEAVKLTENIFRDVNIALVNELSQIYSKIGLDTFEIIDAAKTKQFAFLPHYPGIGVGGECIPIDTWYLIEKAEKIGCEANLMRISREINDSMPFYTVKLVENIFNIINLKLEDATVGILGLAYKPNIADIRVSPSFEIIHQFDNLGIKYKVCDPLVKKAGIRTIPLYDIENTVRNTDALILTTAHDIFKFIKPKWLKNKVKTRLLIDGRNFFNQEDFEKEDFIYIGIGKDIRLNELNMDPIVIKNIKGMVG